jgi:hypothetical protein
MSPIFISILFPISIQIHGKLEEIEKLEIEKIGN